MVCIVCNSQKEGSGKSTVCRGLGVHDSHLGRSVFLIDTDTQSTLTQWHEAQPQRVELARETLPQGLKAAKGAEYVFIDTPPNASEHLDDVFLLAVDCQPLRCRVQGESKRRSEDSLHSNRCQASEAGGA